jgi:hypothetical protein
MKNEHNTATITSETEHASPNAPKRMSVTLTAGDEDKRVSLTILAQRKAGDRGETVVITRDAKKKTSRGMTRKFDTFERAVEALHELQRDAMKKGWTKRERSGGFKARPDAFSTLPQAPSKGKK